MARPSRLIGLALLHLCLLFSSLDAQVETGVPRLGDPVRFYMDCRARGCDAMHIRTEIRWVDHVRDIRDADVYLNATSLGTGGGGVSSDLIFEGRGRFEGMVDTLTYVSGGDATGFEIREGFTQLVKIGLMRFVGLTSMANQIEIGLRPPDIEEIVGRPGRGGPTADPEDDPWDFWVFRIRGGGRLGGRSNRTTRSFNGSYSANRVTEDWKVSLSLSHSYSETIFDFPDLDFRKAKITRRLTHTGSLIKSVAGKWSAGIRWSARNATYNNFDFEGALSPVLEYSVFPYEEATRRSLTFQYAIEGVYHDYREETIYFKNTDTFLTQSLSGSLNFNRKWGGAFVAMEAAHHLEDIKLHHLTLLGGFNLRLARGLTLSVMGDVSRTKDLISIAANADDSVEEILLARKQLQTDYTYSTSISLSYSFGSIFNNIVNPRLGGGGIGIPMIIG